MTEQQLISLIPSLQGQQFTGMSTDSLYRYSRIYAGLYELVTTCGADGLYGDRLVWSDKLRRIFRSLMHRCGAMASPDDQARCIAELQFLQYETGAIAFPFYGSPLDRLTEAFEAAHPGLLAVAVSRLASAPSRTPIPALCRAIARQRQAYEMRKG